MGDTPRERCYHGVRRRFSSVVAAYYKKHPHKIEDPETEQNMGILLGLMLDIIKFLDNYEISERKRDERQGDHDDGRTTP